MERNPNITVTTRNRNLISYFSSRCVRFVLLNIVKNPEVYIVTR